MIGASPVIYALLAAVISLLIAFFLYRKRSRKGKVFIAMAILRFVAIFALLLLLINIKFSNKSFFTEKPYLSILVDNSSSIKELGYEDTARKLLNELTNDEELNNRFSIEEYSFDTDLLPQDSLSFSGNQTNISNALQALENINRGSNGAVLMLSDGNQTYGADYAFTSKSLQQEVYPVVLGDSITYNDLKISQLNVNKYAYFKNKYPVEIFLTFEGKSTVRSVLKIYRGNQLLYSEKVSFDEKNTSKVIKTELLADKIGVQTLKAVLEPLSEEKNKENNSKLFALEVIDQKNNIAIVTATKHPDIGALKKIVESNEFRTASIVDVGAFNALENNFQLVILYQPTNSFNTVIKELKNRKQNYWIISGEDTDWNFLNRAELGFNHVLSGGKEEVLPLYNDTYNSFQTEDIGFDDFPPLTARLGGIDFLGASHALLYKKIGSIATDDPQLVTFDNNEQKAAILLGEGIWKWRAASFIENESTASFDTFFGKLIQYLSSTEKRARLTITSESFYYGNSQVKIGASYFDKNYVFDPNATIKIEVKNKETGAEVVYPMLYKGSGYEVDLSSLPASAYSFMVRVDSEKISKSGSFSILAFDVEKQFVNPDIGRLNTLAENTGGVLYFSDTFSDLKQDLLTNSKYQSVQKSKENIVPLIDWKWLLLVIIIALSSEWFLRKYNGLI
ncbi:vWA domain-containing protein [Joostella sp.]|uniref:vWA domain-containing protein n=1 Tax=Joostella sp. TaxID=2231138 RepID=UPI003A8F36FC